MILVYEVEPDAGATGPRTLVFEWGKSTAEIETYPADWKHLEDAALLGLLAH